MQHRRIVNNEVVCEYIGDSVDITVRVNNHRRTYLLTQGSDGCRLTVTVRGVTEEIPLPRLCGRVAA